MQAEVRVAVVQATPVLFNKSATVDKTIELAKTRLRRARRSCFFPNRSFLATPGT